jgi:hypothetical protein
MVVKHGFVEEHERRLERGEVRFLWYAAGYTVLWDKENDKWE